MNEENKAIANTKRQEYMDRKITHEEYYLWLADFIGATIAMIPVSLERIRQSKDEHLNDITLATWDQQHPLIRSLAFRKGLAWSYSDTVCVLKNLALQAVKQ